MPSPASSWSLLSADHKTDIRMLLGDLHVKLQVALSENSPYSVRAGGVLLHLVFEGLWWESEVMQYGCGAAFSP